MALLLLPLVLVLLMVLFDAVTHGMLVLVGWLLDWLGGFLPSPARGLPRLQMIAFHPRRVALDSLTRSLPCLAGLMITWLRRGAGGSWCWVVLLWVVAACLGGPTVRGILLPGCVAATLLALPRRAPGPR